MGRPTRNRPHDEFVDLCRLEDIVDGGAKGLRPFGERTDSVFVVRRGQTIRVYRNRCPHQGSSMPWRRDAYLNSEGTRIVCHAHGAQFDVDTGACLQGPALGQSLSRLDAVIDDDGVIRTRAADLRG